MIAITEIFMFDEFRRTKMCVLSCMETPTTFSTYIFLIENLFVLESGLFAVSVLVKLSKGLKLWKLMEAFILGQFVVKQVTSFLTPLLSM